MQGKAKAGSVSDSYVKQLLEELEKVPECVLVVSHYCVANVTRKKL